MKKMKSQRQSFILISPTAVSSEQNIADPAGVANALARIGYHLDEALADLVDNAIDASARTILIRFFRDEKSIKSIAIVDDGNGMSENKLWFAMQFGARVRHEESDLGKFGMGLKTASFSQGRSVSVISKVSSKISATRWTLDKIEAGWLCEKLDTQQSTKMLDQDWTHLSLKSKGTVILWESLDHLNTSDTGVDGNLSKSSKYCRSI